MANQQNTRHRPISLADMMIWIVMAIIGGMALLVFAYNAMAVDTRPTPMQGERGDFHTNTGTGASLGIRSNVGVDLNAGSDARANLRTDDTKTMRSDNPARIDSRVDNRVGGSATAPLRDDPVENMPDNVTTNVNTGGRSQTTLGADLGLGR